MKNNVRKRSGRAYERRIKGLPHTNLLALIVGAGAVENAWTPVLRAITETKKPNLDLETANLVLAAKVYSLRWFAPQWSELEKHKFQSVLERYKAFTSKLRAEIIKSQELNEIRTRSEFPQIVQKYINEHLDAGGKLMVVNLNWDTVVDDALESLIGPDFKPTLHVNHIHGSVKSSDALYLPTEIARDVFRTKEETLAILRSHSRMLSNLEAASKCILYGVSLSALDVELYMTVLAGMSPRLRKLTIIDPNHLNVATKLKASLGGSVSPKIIGIDPNRLEEETKYSHK